MEVRVLCSLYRKDCDATSVISFFSPDMDIVRRGETCARRCCSDSARRIRPALMYRFNVSLFAHATVGDLSHNIPM